VPLWSRTPPRRWPFLPPGSPREISVGMLDEGVVNIGAQVPHDAPVRLSVEVATLAQCDKDGRLGGSFEDFLGTKALKVSGSDGEVRRSRKLVERHG